MVWVTFREEDNELVQKGNGVNINIYLLLLVFVVLLLLLLFSYKTTKTIIEHPFQNPSLPHTPSLPSGPCLVLLILFLQHLSRTGIHTETLRVGLTDSNVYSTVGVRPQGIDVA